MGELKKGVSIVIPAYNAIDTICRCIQSALDAGSCVTEVIVVDDGSTDGTERQVDFSDDRVRLVRQENAGVAVARNAGLQCATCDHIAFLDADDVLPKGSIDTLYSIAENESIDMIYGDYEIELPTGIERRKSNVPHGPDGGVVVEELFSSLLSVGRETVTGSACRILFNTKFLQDNGVVFPPGIAMGEDLVMVLSCLEHHPKVMWCDEVVYKINRVHPSASVSYMENIEGDLLFVADRFRESPIMNERTQGLMSGRRAEIAWLSCCTLYKKNSPFSMSERREKTIDVISRYGSELAQLDDKSGLDEVYVHLLQTGRRHPALLWLLLELKNILAR